MTARGVAFEGPSPFARAQFLTDARFEDASFEQPADFAGAEFRGIARFDHARFATGASFDGSVSYGNVSLAHARFELLPLEVHSLPARQVVERSRLDPMHQLPRLALRRNAVEEPPRTDCLGRDPEDPRGQHVQAAEIIQQPGIETELAESGLNRVQVEHQTLRILRVAVRPRSGPQKLDRRRAEAREC